VRLKPLGHLSEEASHEGARGLLQVTPGAGRCYFNNILKLLDNLSPSLPNFHILKPGLNPRQQMCDSWIVQMNEGGSAPHRRGNLNQTKIFEYAQSRKFAEATVGLALLCSVPVDVVERVLLDKNHEITLILAKALAFSWETTMALLFLGASDHRISVTDLEGAKQKFAGLSAEMSRGVLEAYKLRKRTASLDFDDRRLPQLHVAR
jgi:Uncharacterised protein conserved in bacteria (DUF2336)